ACFRGACVGTAKVDACIDDFVCYKTKPSAGESPFAVIPGVHLVDDFEDSHYDLVRPRNLCLPADDHDQGVVDPATHLRTYAIHASAGSPRFMQQQDILVTNQLGI